MASWWGILGLNGLLPSFTILLGISFAAPKWEAMVKEPGHSTKSSQSSSSMRAEKAHRTWRGQMWHPVFKTIYVKC